MEKRSTAMAEKASPDKRRGRYAVVAAGYALLTAPRSETARERQLNANRSPPVRSHVETGLCRAHPPANVGEARQGVAAGGREAIRRQTRKEKR